MSSRSGLTVARSELQSLKPKLRFTGNPILRVPVSVSICARLKDTEASSGTAPPNLFSQRIGHRA